MTPGGYSDCLLFEVRCEQKLNGLNSVLKLISAINGVDVVCHSRVSCYSTQPIGNENIASIVDGIDGL